MTSRNDRERTETLSVRVETFIVISTSRRDVIVIYIYT